MIDRAWVGHVFEPLDVDVELGRLRQFAKAIGEARPEYISEAAARARGFCRRRRSRHDVRRQDVDVYTRLVGNGRTSPLAASEVTTGEGSRRSTTSNSRCANSL